MHGFWIFQVFSRVRTLTLTSEGGGGSYLTVNASTLEAGQEGLDLREWHEKGWIRYTCRIPFLSICYVRFADGNGGIVIWTVYMRRRRIGTGGHVRVACIKCVCQQNGLVGGLEVVICLSYSTEYSSPRGYTLTLLLLLMELV
jgi:hypothetical protein